jgi:3-methyl-2-oxobutanoate hydroxymethyltransferase
MPGPNREKTTVRTLRQMRREGSHIVAVTAYDFPFARWADESGVDIVLVGDSVGMTCLGYGTTVPVGLEDMLHHAGAVVRAVEHAMVVADMPFLSYHLSPEQAAGNAGRLLQEAGVEGVKLEGGEAVAPTVAKLVRCGIPVMGHLGLLPQSVLADGGYRVRGRNEEESEQLLRDALALEKSGAFAIVLEGVAADVAGAVTEAVGIPTVGIGSGPDCSGQIQVLHDVLGMTEDFVPRHAKQYANVAAQARKALAEYRDEVRKGLFPAEEHLFR